jgi:hypothetical protein
LININASPRVHSYYTLRNAQHPLRMSHV